MKTSKRPKNSVRLLLAVLFTLIACSMSCAQLATEANGVTLKNPVYFGYEIGIGIQSYTLKSSISRIDNLNVLREGGYVGVKLANKRAALRANAGLYYSDASVGYSIDQVEGAVSGNIYLLRMGIARSHTFEPYTVVAIAYQRAKFFGAYLETDQKNNSYGNERELGSLRWCTTEFGAGVEFQLHNDNLQFLHFFAEAKYGVPFRYRSSNMSYAQTYVKAPVAISLGVTFGRIR